MKYIDITKYFFLIGFSVVIWLCGILFGYELGGDIYNYEQDYLLKEIGDILYSNSRNISYYFGLNFITYHFIICLMQAIILSKLFIKYKISIFVSCIAIIYLMSMGWIGHFRASFTIFALIFLFLSSQFFILSILSHFGNVGNLVTYIFLKKNKLYSVIIFIFIIIFIINPQRFEFIFEYLGRERFFDSYTGEFDDTYVEHRSLWVFDNLKLWLSLFIIIVCFSNGAGNGKYFLIIPYAAYCIFGFDAYTAQKTYLNFSFFSVLGFHSLSKNKITLLCKLFVIFDLTYGIYSRWQPFL